jgi:hypothetical protein
VKIVAATHPTSAARSTADPALHAAAAARMLQKWQAAGRAAPAPAPVHPTALSTAAPTWQARELAANLAAWHKTEAEEQSAVRLMRRTGGGATPSNPTLQAVLASAAQSLAATPAVRRAVERAVRGEVADSAADAAAAVVQRDLEEGADALREDVQDAVREAARTAAARTVERAEAGVSREVGLAARALVRQELGRDLRADAEEAARDVRAGAERVVRREAGAELPRMVRAVEGEAAAAVRAAVRGVRAEALRAAGEARETGDDLPELSSETPRRPAGELVRSPADDEWAAERPAAAMRRPADGTEPAARPEPAEPASGERALAGRAPRARAEEGLAGRPDADARVEERRRPELRPRGYAGDEGDTRRGTAGVEGAGDAGEPGV